MICLAAFTVSLRMPRHIAVGLLSLPRGGSDCDLAAVRPNGCPDEVAAVATPRYRQAASRPSRHFLSGASTRSIADDVKYPFFFTLKNSNDP